MRICVLKNYIQAIVTTMSYSKYIPISDGFVRYVCAMRYNGTFYSSWTNSGEATNKRPSISEALSHALDKLVGPNCYKNLKLSSRTDAGVHALRNVLQVDLIRRRQKDPNGELLSAHSPYTVKKGLNHFLGENFEKLYITDVSTVNENNTENGDHIALNNTFDVRASSTGRKYIYHILCPSIIDSPICTTNESASTAEDKLNRQEKSSSSFSASSLNELEDTRRLLFHDNLMWVYRRPLNLRAMNQACAHLTGIHDFSSFRSSTCQSQTPYRQVTELRVFSSSFHRNHHWQDSNINLDKKEESFSENFYMVCYAVCFHSVIFHSLLSNMICVYIMIKLYKNI